jgi:hypothetical protein
LLPLVLLRAPDLGLCSVIGCRRPSPRTSSGLLDPGSFREFSGSDSCLAHRTRSKPPGRFGHTVREPAGDREPPSGTTTGPPDRSRRAATRGQKGSAASSDRDPTSCPRWNRGPDHAPTPRSQLWPSSGSPLSDDDKAPSTVRAYRDPLDKQILPALAGVRRPRADSALGGSAHRCGPIHTREPCRLGVFLEVLAPTRN